MNPARFCCSVSRLSTNRGFVFRSKQNTNPGTYLYGSECTGIFERFPVHYCTTLIRIRLHRIHTTLIFSLARFPRVPTDIGTLPSCPPTLLFLGSDIPFRISEPSSEAQRVPGGGRRYSDKRTESTTATSTTQE